MNRTIKNVALSCIGVAAVVVAVLAGHAQRAKKEAQMPKYVILLIGDGMSFNSIAMTENYLAYKEGLHYGGPRLKMRSFPYFGMVETYCYDNVVTCSAAAGTAIACGQKTRQNYEGVDPDGQSIENIAEKLHAKGYNIGIVTDEPINHATPVAFYGHSTSRSHYGTFAKQLAESGFEMFAGNGFLQDRRAEFNGFDDLQYARENGYDIVYSADDLRAAGAKACLFQPSSRVKQSTITAEADSLKKYDIEEAVQGDFSVKQMLELTIEKLGTKKPFFIMCEGGDIDHAAHANFTMSVVNEILEFDEAVASAIAFYEKHPDETLILVTADHETGGVAVGGPRPYGKDNWVNWELLEADWKANKSRGYDEGAFCHDLSQQANVGFFSFSHTSGCVPVFALGKHAERFQTAMDNTEFVSKIMN